MSSISLDNAWLLLIAVPLLVLIVIPFVIAIRKDNRNGHNVASCAIHIILAAIIAFAAAGVTVETTLTETDVFVVADVSYSANRNLDLVDEYIRALQENLPNNSQMGVICFGKDSVRLTDMGDEFTTVKEAAVDDSQTDIVQALQYAGKLFKDNVIKRIVLITDSKQTAESTDDELKQTIDDLLSSNIQVDAIYLNNNITDAVTEVQLTGVECNQTAYKGKQSAVTATIQSTRTVYATVSLYEEDGSSVISERNLTLGAGSNEVVFSLSEDREEGLYGYKIAVSSEEDLNPYNNTCSFSQQVEGSVNVLFITGDDDDADEAESVFGGSYYNLDVYCNTATVPYTVPELCEYDIIVLADIDVSTLNNYQMFVDSIDVVVSVLGKRVVAIGDLGIQDKPDDEALVKLSGILPVNYGNPVRDAKLYIILIDCSYSMFIQGRLSYAKDAASAVVDLLDENDELIVIKFYSENEIIYNGLVGDGEEAKKAIGEIEAKQGTMLSGTLKAVGEAYESANNSSKSVLVITDGLESTSDLEQSIEYTKKLNESGIGTSVIHIVDDYYRETNGGGILEELAAYGSGCYYNYFYGKNLGDDILPAISDDISGALVEDVWAQVDVSYKNYNDSVLDGLKSEGAVANDYTLSYIEGYILSSAKSGAATILSTSYKMNNSSQKISVPVYSYWSYGNGGAASFTSSFSGEWVKNWEQKGILKTFFGDVLNTNVPDERIDTPYSVTVNRLNDSYKVEIVPVEVRAGATVKVTVTEPDEEEGTALSSVVFDSSVFSCTFPADKTGTYKITIDYEYKGVEYNSYDYYAHVPYLTEYDSFTLFDASLLYKVLGSNGTVSEDGNLTIVNDENTISKRTVSLTVPLLIAAVSLFIIDIIIRKLKWNDIVSLFKKVNKGRKS